MSCIVSPGGVFFEDPEMIKILVIMEAESKRKDTHCCKYFLFTNYMGKKWVFISFSGNTPWGTQLDLSPCGFCLEEITKLPFTP